MSSKCTHAGYLKISSASTNTLEHEYWYDCRRCGLRQAVQTPIALPRHAICNLSCQHVNSVHKPLICCNKSVLLVYKICSDCLTTMDVHKITTPTPTPTPTPTTAVDTIEAFPTA